MDYLCICEQRQAREGFRKDTREYSPHTTSLNGPGIKQCELMPDRAADNGLCDAETLLTSPFLFTGE